MNEKAIYDLTYGLFLIGSKAEEKENICVVNTVMQVAGSPTRVTLSCINGNLTPELIKASGYFTAAILDETVEFDTFKQFGLQHGSDVNKLEGYDVEHDVNGIPFLKTNACSVLSCKVISCQDLGSHTLFIAEVVDAEKFSDSRPVTYAEYHSRIKPKRSTKETPKEIIGWKCTICGYVYEGAELPEDFTCPWCGHPASDFEPVYKE
ncbi:MAG: flavin reductase [Solobacterium sp.]|nr:flavin reductase [Solobacterium sp.]